MDFLNTENKLNDLLGKFFKMNSITDNMSYALAIELKCPNASKIFHEKYAHAFPSNLFADFLSDSMIMLGYRPKRCSFDGDISEYNSIVDLFKDNFDKILELKNFIEYLIDELDCEISNKILVLKLEELLNNLAPFIHQSKIWLDLAKNYVDNNDVYKFNLNFEKITYI